MEAVNRSLIICMLALSQSAFAAEVQFDDLRANFKHYDGRQVTVKGILEVAGNDNYLYRDIQAREHQSVWIHVLPNLNRPDSAGGLAPDAPANLHWVKNRHCRPELSWTLRQRAFRIATDRDRGASRSAAEAIPCRIGMV